MSFIEFDGIKIFYQVKGQGKPLLLGHSYLWDSNMWNEVTEILQENYTCITVDLPGHGQSESLENISLEKLSYIHREVMLHLGYDTFYLVGLSIGAMWGSILCLDQKINVKKFIIMNSSLSAEPEESKQLYLGMLKLIENTGAIPAQLIEQIAPGFFSERHADKYLDSFKTTLSSFSSAQLKAVVACGRAFVNRGRLLDAFKAYKNDLLVIAGEFDYYRSIEEARLIAAELRKETVIIPAGHISAKEIPHEVSELIGSFLN